MPVTDVDSEFITRCSILPIQSWKLDNGSIETLDVVELCLELQKEGLSASVADTFEGNNTYHVCMLYDIAILIVYRQKMDLILKRPGGYISFQSEWKDKWAPAIL